MGDTNKSIVLFSGFLRICPGKWSGYCCCTMYQLDEQVLFHSLKDYFVRDEFQSLDTQDYSTAGGGEAVENCNLITYLTTTLVNEEIWDLMS